MRWMLFALAALLATPANAERMLVDYRLYPPLQTALQHQDENVYFLQSKNPKFTLDRIKIQGPSLDAWQEVIEFVILPRKKELTAPRDWFQAFQNGENRACPSTWEILGADETSIMFSRTGAKCAMLGGQSRIYRALLGKKSVFIVAGSYRGDLNPEMRVQWIKLFETASLAP